MAHNGKAETETMNAILSNATDASRSAQEADDLNTATAGTVSKADGMTENANRSAGTANTEDSEAEKAETSGKETTKTDTETETVPQKRNCKK